MYVTIIEILFPLHVYMCRLVNIVCTPVYYIICQYFLYIIIIFHDLYHYIIIPN